MSAGQSLITGFEFRNRNLGVGALALSALGLLYERLDRRVAAIDFNAGLRRVDETLLRQAGLPADAVIEIHGFSQTRRFWRPESALFAELSIRTGARLGSIAPLVADSAALLDVSGGDSFSDIYGRRRFVQMCRPKLLALALKRPLVLLPQTFGPYRDPRTRAMAIDIIARADCAVARDVRSHDVVRELLGARFDPKRHLVGTDMAFRLPSVDPPASVLEIVERARKVAKGAPVAGFNVSGLLANQPGAWREYGFRDDYLATCVALAKRLLASGAGAIVLLPHVILPPDPGSESDVWASQRLVAALTPAERERVLVASGFELPTEAKAVIRRLDWFTGSRLHATIAALSSGVSTATIAYSDKARGIFEALGVGETVADPRQLASAEIVEHQVRAFTERERHRATITGRLPDVLSTVDRQMDEIARVVKSARRA